MKLAFVLRGSSYVDDEALGEVDGRVAREGAAGVDGDWELQQVTGHEYAESCVANCDEGDGDIAVVEVGDRFEGLCCSRFKHVEAIGNGRIQCEGSGILQRPRDGAVRHGVRHAEAEHVADNGVNVGVWNGLGWEPQRG